MLRTLIFSWVIFFLGIAAGLNVGDHRTEKRIYRELGFAFYCGDVPTLFSDYETCPPENIRGL